MRSLLTIALMTSFVFIGCREMEKLKGGETEKVDSSVEAGLSIIESFLNDATSGDVSPKVLQTSCTPISEAPCIDGVKSVAYSGCINHAGATVTGNARGYFYLEDGSVDAECLFEGNGSFVTGDFDIRANKLDKFRILQIVERSNKEHVNYLGDTIGGERKIVRLEEEKWTFEAAGERLVRHLNMVKFSDVSGITGSPVTLTGKKVNDNAIIDGGSIILYHNIAEFTATIEPRGLKYVSDCDHPVEGSIRISYENASVSTITIEFDGCTRPPVE